MAQFPESDRRGSFTLTVFALAWTAAGTGAASPAFVWVGVIASVLAAVAVQWRAQRAPRVGAVPPPMAMRRFGLVNAAQALAIALVVALLLALDATRYLPAAVCAVVAAHFVPLAGVFGQRFYLLLAALLGLVAAIGLAVALGDAERSLGFVGLAAAAVLLAGAWHLAGSPQRAVGAGSAPPHSERRAGGRAR